MILDDIPLATELQLGRSAPRIMPTSRRSFIKGTTAVLTTLGMYAVGLVRFAPTAFASYPPYEDAMDCNHYGIGNCTGKGGDGCVGSEDNNLYTDNKYCSLCEDAVGHCSGPSATQWQQYCYNGVKNGATLQDRTGNICEGTTYDDWEHIPDPTACGYCPTTIWRCHDGYKGNSTGFHKMICHGLVKCVNTTIPRCPTSCT